MTDTTLIQRLRTDVLWYRRRGNETIAEDCRQAADALEQQAAQIAMLEQRATCGCGDQFTAHDPGTCGNCCAAADRSNEIEALRADAERWRHVQHGFAAQSVAIDGMHSWTWRGYHKIGKGANIDEAVDAALRQEQPKGEGA